MASGQIAQQFEKTDKLRFVADERSQRGFENVTDTQRTSSKGTPQSTLKGTHEKGNHLVKRKLKLWMYRPYSRVVRGYKNNKIDRNYIQLNEKEALGEITYKKNRLRGLSKAEWEILWT